MDGRRCSISTPPAIIYPSIINFQRARADPWFDLNLNFGRSYIHAARVQWRRGGGEKLATVCSSLSFRPCSPWTFIQWITSLVATFRGLLIPAGQIIQIGLLHSCPNLMSVMLLRPPPPRTLRPVAFQASLSFPGTHPLAASLGSRSAEPASAPRLLLWLSPSPPLRRFGSPQRFHIRSHIFLSLSSSFFPLCRFKVASTWGRLSVDNSCLYGIYILVFQYYSTV